MQDETGKVPIRTYIGLGVPQLAIGAWYYPILILLPPYLSETWGLALIGSIFIAVRFFDLFTDTWIGRVSDLLPELSKGRLGRRKPPILVGLAMFMIGLAALLIPSIYDNLGVLIAVLVFVMLGETLMRIPYKAWVAETVTDYNARSRMAALRSMLVYVGVIIAAIGGSIGEGEGDAQMRLVGALYPVIFMAPIVVLGSVFLLKEVARDPSTYSEERPASFFGAVRQLSKNSAFVRLAIVNFVHEYADAINSALMVFFIVNVMLLPDDVSPNFIVGVLIGVGGLFLWAAISQRFDKHKVMIAALIGAIATSLSALLLTPGDPTALLTYMAVLSFFASADGVMLDSMEADIIDADEAQFGERRAGMVSGTMTTIGKLPEALGTGMVFLLLAWLGFDPNSEGTEAETVRYVFVILPVALKLVVLGLLWRYPIGAKYHAELRSQIARKREPDAAT